MERDKGGIIAVLFTILMGITVFFTAGHNELPAAIMIYSPFIISGSLFLICWYRSGRREVKDEMG